MIAWIRYRHLTSSPEGVHRYDSSVQPLLFNARVDDGLVNVLHKSLVDRLLRTGNYEVALERYGVVYGSDGVEQEVFLAGTETDTDTTTDEEPTTTVTMKPKGKYRKG